MIKIENLCKRFDNHTAVDHVSLHIRRGEVFGLLGPNGAGKTTLIRILTMLTKPSVGKVIINGWNLAVMEQKIKSIIGVVPQSYNLDVDLTAWENMELHGRLHHITNDVRKRKISELLSFVDLQDRANERVLGFSGGMKRRLMIARALLHKPQILYLDEPTVGLDPQVRRKLWDLISRMNSEGLTVVITTHYIEEAENLCQRVAFINNGKLVTCNSPAVLCEQFGKFVVEWTDAEFVTNQRYFTERTQAAKFSAALSNAIIRRVNLEDVFVELTGRKVAL